MRRREFIGTGVATAGALAFGPAFWRNALAAPATPGAGPYGDLQAANANALMLPAGFTSREIARGGQPVVGAPPYLWHIYSDGQATYPTQDGGWILVSNSESVAASGAGSSAIRFAPDGAITGAYRILAGTNANCAGGPTPWGTWLSCEEFDGGQVWECDPAGVQPAVPRPAMGLFSHEAVCVDPVGKKLYMTEDKGDSGFYRFTPTTYPDLSSGLLEVAKVDASNNVTWAVVPQPTGLASGTATRDQVAGMREFKGGEGTWFDSGVAYFTTKGDNKVWTYTPATAKLDLIYDRAAVPSPPLSGVDNITVSRFGDVYVCEDGGNLEICLITPDGTVAPFCRLTGTDHAGPQQPSGDPSEMAGVVFNPAGNRMYFASQRGFGTGAVFEVSGPFRQPPGPPAPVVDPGPGTGDPGTGTGDPGTGGGISIPGPTAAPAPTAAGPGTRDVDPPGLKLDTRLGTARILTRGLRVRVGIDEPGSVTVALTTSDLASTPGARGSIDRPKQVTLATARRRYERAGRYVIVLKLGKRARARLRGRRKLTARVVASARDAAGNTATATREVTLRP